MKTFSRALTFIICFELAVPFEFAIAQESGGVQEILAGADEVSECDVDEGAYDGIPETKAKIIKAAIKDYIAKQINLKDEKTLLKKTVIGEIKDYAELISMPLKLDECELKKLEFDSSLIELMADSPGTKEERAKLKASGDEYFDLMNLAGIEYVYYADMCQLPANLLGKKEDLATKIQKDELDQMFKGDYDALFLYSKVNGKDVSDLVFGGSSVTPIPWANKFAPDVKQLQALHGSNFTTSASGSKDASKNWEANELNKIKKRKMADKVYGDKNPYVFTEDSYPVDVEKSTLLTTEAVKDVWYETVDLFDENIQADVWDYSKPDVTTAVVARVRALSKDPNTLLGRNGKIVGIACEGSASTLWTAFSTTRNQKQYIGNTGLAELRTTTCIEAGKNVLKAISTDSELKKHLKNTNLQYEDLGETNQFASDVVKKAVENITNGLTAKIVTGGWNQGYNANSRLLGTSGYKDWRCLFSSWMGEKKYGDYCNILTSSVSDSLTNFYPDDKKFYPLLETTVGENFPALKGTKAVDLFKKMTVSQLDNPALKKKLGEAFYQPYQKAELQFIIEYEQTGTKVTPTLVWETKECTPILVAKFMFFKENKDCKNCGGGGKTKKKKRKKSHPPRYLNCKAGKMKVKKKRECQPFKIKFRMCPFINRVMFGIK